MSHRFCLLSRHSRIISAPELHALVDHRTPIDALEPNPTKRELMRDFAYLMNRYAIFITEAENARLAAWQGALAIGLPCCEGRSYEEIARICGVGILSPTKGRAAVSKGTRYFCDANDLQPSFYMKRNEAREKYKQSRKQSIINVNAGPQ